MSPTMAALFQRLTQGVYVIGVADGATVNAFTAAWVMQVSFDPVLVALSINPHNASYAVLTRGRCFSVNVLGKHQLDLAARFGRPSTADKLADVDWSPGPTGAPLLSGALAWLDCRVGDRHPAGDHELVVGRVVDGHLMDAAAEPLTYRDTGTLDGAAALFPDGFGR